MIEKSRRIGLSWAEAYDAVMHAATGEGNVYYQAYDREMTRTFIDDAAEWSSRLSSGAAEVGETVYEDGAGAVQVFRLGFASGCEIRSMTSSPRGFRSKGRPGDRAIIDEAAFVDDLDAVLKAALAFRMWGGTVHIISTHNGEFSAFAGLLRDIKRGLIEGSAHTVTLTDALNDGLYKRICAIRGTSWSRAAQSRWVRGLRSEYGARASEELDCVPLSGHASWLSWSLIRGAESVDAGDPARFGGGETYIGVDIARRRDLWVAAVIEKVGDVLWLRDLVVRRDISFREQGALVSWLNGHYRPVRIAVDQTGMGEALVERWREGLGRNLVEGVQMSPPRRLDVASALRERLEDGRLRIPADEALRADLHSVRSATGTTGSPRLLAGRSAGLGHADRFWALALACAAARSSSGPFRARSLGRGFETQQAYGADRVRIDFNRRVLRSSMTFSGYPR